MKKLAISLAALSLLAGTAVLAPHPVVARQEAQATLSLPTTTAQTAQVTVTRWGIKPVPQGQPFGPIQKLQSNNLTLDIAKNKGRIQEIADPTAPDGYRPSFSVYDGTTVYYFIGARNQYQKLPTASMKDGLAGSFGMPGVPLVFGWKNGSADKFQPVADETVDGASRKVYAYTVKQNTPNGDVTLTQKLYVDPATKLPARFSYFVQEPGKELIEAIRTEFTDWKINQPVDATQLAWTPPAGSAEYKQPERPPLLTAGTMAPDFTCEKLEGGALHLSDYKGKVVILDFWATWCGPCQASMPHLQSLAEKIKDKDVVVLGLCVWDEKKDYEQWMPKNKSKYSTFQFAFDPEGRGEKNVAKALYKVSGIPTTYIIGRDGKVVDAHVGFRQDDTRIAESLAKVGIAVPGEKTASAK